jgi:hypothetical protein
MADKEGSRHDERPDNEGHREPERHETPRDEHKEKAPQKGKVGQFVSDHKLAVASVVIGLIGLWLFIRHQSSSAASQAGATGTSTTGATTPSDVTGGGGGYLPPGTLEPGTLPPGATGGQPGGTLPPGGTGGQTSLPPIFISYPPPTGGTPPPSSGAASVSPTLPSGPPPSHPRSTPKAEAKQKPSPKPTKTRTVAPPSSTSPVRVPAAQAKELNRVSQEQFGQPGPFYVAPHPQPKTTAQAKELNRVSQEQFGQPGPFYVAPHPQPKTTAQTHPFAQKPSPHINSTTGLAGAGRTHIDVPYNAPHTHIGTTPHKPSPNPKPRYEVGRTMVRP